MRYAAVESQPLPLTDRIVFTDLGYLYGQKGSTFIDHDHGGNLGKAIREGVVQTSAPLLDAKDIPLDEWEHKEKAMGIFKHYFPHYQEQNISGELLDTYLMAIYVLLGPNLDQEADWLFCCVAPEDDIPLVNVARKIKVRCVNVLDEKTIYRIQNYVMDNTLQF